MRKTEKYGIISILLALLILCYLDGVILAEKKDKNHNKKNEPAEKNTVTESVEASARNKPAKWDGEAPGKGDNRDDLKSGKVDVVGDGNSGQGNRQNNKPTKPITVKPLPPATGGYELENIAQVTYETEERYDAVKKTYDPSIVNFKLLFRPINYNRNKGTFQVKATFKSVKVKHIDGRCNFNYDFSKAQDRREAWNRLWLAAAKARKFRKVGNNVPGFYAYSEDFFDEMLKCLVCVILPNRSFTFEVSRFGDTLELIDFDQMIAPSLAQLPDAEVTHLKKILTDHVLNELRLIFPKIPQKKPDGQRRTVDGWPAIKYSTNEREKSATEQHKLDQRLYYSLKYGLTIYHEKTKNDSSIRLGNQAGTGNRGGQRVEWEKRRHKISLLNLVTK